RAAAREGPLLPRGFPVLGAERWAGATEALDQAGTVVVISYERQRVGEYRDRKGRVQEVAWRRDLHAVFVDRASGRAVGKKVFEGSNPSSSYKKGDYTEGSA